MTYSGDVLDNVVRDYLDGGLVDELLNSVHPPITTYMFYKRLKDLDIEKRGQISRKYEITPETLLECKNCKKIKPAKEFSKHIESQNGYDRTRCKICKKSMWDWKQVPIEKRIFQRLKLRSKEKNLVFSLQLSDIVLPDFCPIFKREFIYGNYLWTYSVDRFDNTKGYEKDNISIISNKANMIKSTASKEELRMVADWMEEQELSKSSTYISSFLKTKIKTIL